MPPRTRSYWKARRLTKFAHHSTRAESISENNLEICITNYFKEDADYKHFKGNHCHHFDTLREVFDKHGTSGGYTNDSGHPPLDTDEEREFENLHSGQDKAKTPMSVIDTDSDDVEVVRPRQEKNKGKGKGKGKGKRKTPENSHGGCCRRSGPPPVYERYLEQLSQHIQTAHPNSSSMSVSFGSPTPEPPVQDKPYSVTNCMKLLHALEFPPDTNARVAPKLFMDEKMCVIFVESTVEERRALVRQNDVVLNFMDGAGNNGANNPFNITAENLQQHLLVVAGIIGEYELNSCCCIPRTPCRTSSLTGQQWVEELINGHHNRIFENTRMDVRSFLGLVDILQVQGLITEHPSRKVSVEEGVAMALVCVSHKHTQRVLAECFQHSLETINRHVSRSLRAIVKLAPMIIRPMNENGIHPRIRDSRRFFPWFMDCIGAIDGTHVSAWAHSDMQDAYRKIKGLIT